RGGVVEEGAGGGTDLLVVEEKRVGTLDLPGREERRPVDIGDELGDRIVAEDARPEEGRPRRAVAGPVDREAVVARLLERDPALLRHAAGMALGDLAVLGAHLVDIGDLALAE